MTKWRVKWRVKFSDVNSPFARQWRVNGELANGEKNVNVKENDPEGGSLIFMASGHFHLSEAVLKFFGEKILKFSKSKNLKFFGKDLNFFVLSLIVICTIMHNSQLEGMHDA